MSRSGLARDYMSTQLVLFTPEMDIHVAIKALLQNRISGAPVVDEDGKLVGVLTKKDCLKIAFSASYHQDWGGCVSELMSAEVETVQAETDIVEIAELFLNSRFHRFPVLQDGRMVGLISRHDVLRALEQLW